MQLLQSDSKRLNEALCWSILNDLELVHRYENVSGKKISDEERQNIIKGNIYIPGEWSFGAGPWNNGSSNYQMVNLNLSDTWVAHYLQILQMLVEIRYLKAIHKSLHTRYEAQFDKDVVPDPGFEQTLYLAKDIFTSAIPMLKPQ